MSILKFSRNRLNSKNISIVPPGLPGFPTAYNTLIDNFVGTKYYIDPVNGSDSNNGLTSGAAFATYSQFYTVTSAMTSSIMCIFMQGTHTLSNMLANAYSGAYGNCAIKDNNYQRTYVCAGGNSIFNWSATVGLRDASPFELQNANSAVYGGVWKRDNNGRSGNYTVSWINNTTVYFSGKLYNCVLHETNTNQSWSLAYANGGYSSGTQVNYCTFYTSGATNPGSSYASGANLVLTNCVNNGASLTGYDASATFVNHVSATLSSSYVASSGTSGVYFGTYAWT